MNIWFTSDTHYHHKNIVRGTTTWGEEEGKGIHSVQKTRPFATLEEHDQTLVDNINRNVGENDILYHLGDWSFGGIEQIWNFRKQLKCKNIHLIYGNHDHHQERNAELRNVHVEWQRTDEPEVLVDGPCPRVSGPDKFSIHPAKARELFKSSRYYTFSKIGGQSMVLCHFSMRVWDKAHHGTWMLYGHSHGTLSEYCQKDYGVNTGDMKSLERKYFKTMDVGVDTHPEFRPYHFDEIAKIMKDRVNLEVDHHNKHTN